MVLVLLKGAGIVLEQLYLEPIDPLQALWVGESLTAEKATLISGIKTVVDRNLLDQNMSKYLTDSRAAIFGELKYLYLDLERRDMKHLPSLSNMFASSIQKKYPNVVISNIHTVLSRLRSVKHESEINHMKEAISITKEGIESLMIHAKAGLKEYQLEGSLQFSLKF